MISDSAFKKIIELRHHFPKLDERGALLIPTKLKLKDLEFMKYRHLPVNWEIGAVTEDNLPEEFSPKAVKIVDLFRRKTIDLDYEVMLIFDYETGDLVYCFVNDLGHGDEVFGEVNEKILIEKSIAVIHNHPMDYGSPPSSENFQILGLEFQDYEILSSWDGIWIIESKESIHPREIINIKNKIQEIYDYSCEISAAEHVEENEIISRCDELYGNLLLGYINNHYLNVKLTKTEL